MSDNNHISQTVSLISKELERLTFMVQRKTSRMTIEQREQAIKNIENMFK